MEKNIIYSSEYIVITMLTDGFYIESFRNGMSVDQFNRLMVEHPEIRITSFMAIKNALVYAPSPPTKFGELKDRVSVEISSDELRAYITLCVNEGELSQSRKSVLIKEILQCLNQKGIVYGIKHDVLLNNLCSNKQILIAEGMPPINGEDSIIEMYKLKDAKPEIKEDGNVDHYELNLINRVNAGDWLGQRTDPTEGVPGKTVKGNTILPMPGKKYPLLFDRHSVKEVYENGATTLYAIKAGAVHYEGDIISVSNHLEISDSIDFKTGNVDFDGFVTIKGSIEDGFSVMADQDIEILGEYGVGSVRDIISREGSVYIKGGIAGKNKAAVRCKRDLYTKYISDATVICDGSVHIGFYCLNSNIVAKEVIVDSHKGQIIGGNIQAEIKVVSSIIGSAGEKRTMISVKGFDRRKLKEKLEKVVADAEALKIDLTKVKQEISIYSNADCLTDEQKAAYERVKDRFMDIKNKLKLVEDDKRSLANYLRTHGEGEVAILKKVYPKTVLEIKRIVKEIHREIMGTNFYVQDGQIKEI